MCFYPPLLSHLFVIASDVTTAMIKTGALALTRAANYAPSDLCRSAGEADDTYTHTHHPASDRPRVSFPPWMTSIKITLTRHNAFSRPSQWQEINIKNSHVLPLKNKAHGERKRHNHKICARSQSFIIDSWVGAVKAPNRPETVPYDILLLHVYCIRLGSEEWYSGEERQKQSPYCWSDIRWPPSAHRSCLSNAAGTGICNPISARVAAATSSG